MFSYPNMSGRFAHGERGYAVVDLETTGFDAEGPDRIVEIAIVRLDPDGRELGVFETLVNPLRDVGPTAVHGITSAMAAAAPPFAEIAASVLAWLDGVVIVAHNAPFEEAFLKAELGRAGLRVPQLPAVDTLPLAQATIDLPNYKLATLCAWAGVDLVAAHTALGDALATAHLLPMLIGRNGHPRWQAEIPRLGYTVSGRYYPRSGITAGV